MRQQRYDRLSMTTHNNGLQHDNDGQANGHIRDASQDRLQHTAEKRINVSPQGDKTTGYRCGQHEPPESSSNGYPRP